MRRRDLFTLTTAIAGCAVAGCTLGNPRPATEPRGEIPIGFADSPIWSGTESLTTFTAVRDRHLVAMTVVPDAEPTFAHGWVPVVVDVAGPTTRALLLDDDGAWITKSVTPKRGSDSPRTQLSGTAHTVMFQGPAVIDATHAYIVVGVLPLDTPGQFEGDPTRTPRDLRCPVMLFRIRLDDGAVVAATTVSDDFAAHTIPDAALSFTEDGAALLLAGGDTDEGGSGWIGLRLSAADLNVEFDARALYVGQEIRSMSSAGQAVLVSWSTSPSKELVRLADGVRMPTGSDKVLVIGDWAHHVARTGDPLMELFAVNTRTGERIDVPSVPGGPKALSEAFTSCPRIFSDAHAIITQHGKGIAVWRPGAPEPSLRLPDDKVSRGAAVLKDVLYSWHGDDRTATLTLRRLDSGEVFAERPVPPRVLGSGAGAITRWGGISGNEFFPATEWLE